MFLLYFLKFPLLHFESSHTQLSNNRTLIVSTKQPELLDHDDFTAHRCDIIIHASRIFGGLFTSPHWRFNWQ